jgi:hypothetical protein
VSSVVAWYLSLAGTLTLKLAARFYTIVPSVVMGMLTAGEAITDWS